MIHRWRRFEFETYFLPWKYNELAWFSHSVRGILLLYCTPLWSALRTWEANSSRLVAWSHSVWVEMSAGSSFELRISWSNWGSGSLVSGSGSSVSNSIEARLMSDKSWTGDRCNWMRSKVTVLHCKLRILSSKTFWRSSWILESKTWDFSTVWCWCRWQGSWVSLSLERLPDRWVKASGLPLAFPGQYVIQ